MLRKQWQEYASKARQIAKHIVTGDEVNKDGTRLDKVIDNLDIYATAALNKKYLKEGSESNVHTYWGGSQEIATVHKDGSEGLFQPHGVIRPTTNAMDIEVEEYMNNLDENKQYRNINKKLIRLTESDLHRIVRTSINKILKESLDERSTEPIPSWALCYLVNGDPPGLEDEEIREIENWLKRTGFTNVCPPNDEEESYFAHYPAFGKAADVYDCVCW